jgi:hypothetical protein
MEAADPAQLRLTECLRDILRFNDRQIQVLQGDGYVVAEDLAHWSYEDITTWVSHKEKLRANAGGSPYGDMKRKSLIALAWWITEKVRVGAAIDLDKFDDQARRAAIIESKVEYESSKDELSIDKPDKFKYEDWPEWEKSVYTYLYSIKNSIGIPLVYVIRKPIFIRDLEPRDQMVINNASLNGAVFRSDSQRVLVLLRSLTTGTDAENWMHGINCGRLAMEALQSHYDGDAEAEKRKQAAKSDLQTLFYRHEAAFSFEKYINRMKKCFNTLEKYQVPYYEEDKVKLLLDKIQNNHGEVKTQVSICRASYSSTFVEASTYMSREISRIFPSSNVASATYGKGKQRNASRNISSLKNRRQKGKRLIVEKNNGVDISDLTRYYSKEEWKKLDADVKKRILENPTRKKIRAEKDQKRDISAVITGNQLQNDANSGIVTNSIDKESEDRIVAAVIRGVIESSRSNQGQEQDRSVGQVVSRPTHGSHVGSVVGSVTGSVRSRGSSVTFDQSTHFRP